MKAVHVISNNAVVIRDTDGKNCIVTGKGIGFKKRKGDLIESKEILNVFTENNWYKEKLLNQHN